MKKVIKFTIVISLLFCSSAPAIPKGNIESKILDERIVDAPLKTQIVQEILIKGNLSKETVTKFIWERYNSLKNRHGFKFHSSPTNIGVYLYISKEHYSSGMGQWLAMIYSRIDENTPKVEYSTSFQGQLESLSAKPEKIFGLSEEKRKTIWEESIHAEDRSWAGAEKGIPNPQSVEDLRRTGDLQEKLNKEYDAEIIKKYGTSKEILKGIQLEGLRKGWPMPPTDKRADSDKKAIIRKSVSKTRKYPTGIGSVNLGDSKRTVFDKIKRSKYINFPDYCDPTFDKWLKDLNGQVCQGNIKLFDKKFSIEWKFSKRNKLYRIVLGEALVAIEYSYDKGLSAKKKLGMFIKDTTQAYSQKYGKPTYLDLSAYPPKDGSCPYVAQWKFPNNVFVEMYVCRISEGIYFFIGITDLREELKVQEDEKEKMRRERERKNREMKKTQELI